MRKLSVVVFAAALLLGLGQLAFAAGMNLPPSSERVIKGSVINNKGKPIPGATVYYLRFDEKSKKMNKTTIHADKKGEFSQAVSGTRTELFSAVAKGHSYASARVSEAQDTFEITLWPSYKLRAKVTDENGEPLAGVNVAVGYFEARNRDGSSQVSFDGVNNSAASDKSGSVVLDHLVDPNMFDDVYCALISSKTAHATMQCSFSKSQFSDDMRIVCPNACDLEGKLSLPGDAGPAPEGYGVIVVPAPSENSYCQPLSGKIDNAGSFIVKGIPVGKASVIVMTPGSPSWSSSGESTAEYCMPAKVNMEMKAGRKNSVDLELCKGVLVGGVVTDKTIGKPAAKARIQVTHAGRPGNTIPEILTTDAEGKFSTRVVPGEVKVMVQSYERNWYGGSENTPSTTFTVAEGDVKTDVKLEITREVVSSSANAEYNPIPADFELKEGIYDLKWDPSVDCQNIARMSCMVWDYLASFRVKKSPQLVSAKPRYWNFKFDNLGDGMLGLILDESQGTGKGYDRVYFDTDRDWDLSDETPLTFKAAPIYKYALMDVPEIKTTTTDAPALKFGVMLSGSKGDEWYGNFFRAGVWKGTIETNKGAVECVLVDGNCNGVYGDFIRRGNNARFAGYGDKLYINTNGAPQPVLIDYGTHFVALDSVVKIGEKFYWIRPSERGDKLDLKPYDGPMGSLSVRLTNLCGMSGTASAASVISKQGSFDFNSLAGKPMVIPAGEWRVMVPSMVVSSGSERLKLGFECLASAKVAPDIDSVLDVKGGKLTAGLPIASKPIVWTVGKTEALKLIVKMGQDVLVNSIGDGSVKFAPRVSFIDKNGKTVRTVTAGYT